LNRINTPLGACFGRYGSERIQPPVLDRNYDELCLLSEATHIVVPTSQASAIRQP